MALELEDLGEEYVPRPHRHAPLPVTFGGRVDALAACDPGIQEQRSVACACDYTERNVQAASGFSAETPNVRAQAIAGDEARDFLALIFKIR